VAVLTGLAVLLLAPGANPSAPLPVSDVLGARGTPAPIPALDPAARAAAARERFAVPDPGAADRAPARRLAPDPATLGGYVWPLRDARLTLPYGPSDWGSRIVDGVYSHDGIDLATRCGDRIVAAHGGVVLAAGRDYDDFMGWAGDLTAYRARLDAKHLWPSLPIVVVIDDGNGYRSVYAHFRALVVAAGDEVAAGDLLGYEGMTGRASGCHLHYTIFSPYEETLIGFDPVAAGHMLLPTQMVARIDPLVVLPSLESGGIR
jgi:murein DD-endopeptidase MepM/ murein hydrolase activator NlpD